VKWKGYPAWESTWEKEENLENAQKELSRFRQEVEKREKERVEEIRCIFKGVESVAEHHGDKEIEEMRKRF
jgi:hypothetical protein